MRKRVWSRIIAVAADSSAGGNALAFARTLARRLVETGLVCYRAAWQLVWLPITAAACW